MRLPSVEAGLRKKQKKKEFFRDWFEFFINWLTENTELRPPPLCAGPLASAGGYSSYKLTLAPGWERARAAYKKVKFLGSWSRASWIGRSRLTGRPIWMFFLAGEQRTVGILLLITGDDACQHVSVKRGPVVTFCSFYLGVCWFTGVLTAGTCVISVSIFFFFLFFSNDSWPTCCSRLL